MTATWPKIEIFKIQDGGGRHLENRFFGHNRLSDFSDILYEEAELHVNKGYMTKTANFKNPRWRTPPFWKSLNRHSEKSSDFDEIWYTTLDIEPGYSYVTKNWKFLKFKMAAAAILKFAFLAITRRAIVRFQRNFVWGSRTAGRQGLHDKNCKFLKSNMADRRHFENR